MKTILFPLALAAALAGPASADVLFYEANLDGAHVVPPTPSPATGHADITIDTDTNTITLSLTYQDLSGPVTDVHVHGFAPEGANAPILEHIHEEDLVNFPIEHEFTYSEVQEPFYISGLSFLVMHTDEYLDGEIRGQIVPVAAVSVAPTSWSSVKGLYR